MLSLFSTGTTGLLLAPALLLLGVAAPTAHATPYVDRLPDYYHTTADLLDAFRQLADGGCGGGARLTLTTAGDDVPLTVATFTADDDHDGSHARPKDTAFVLFGEHARELISPETALRMARDLCGVNAPTRALARAVLARSDVVMVPVANPQGRASVEGGDYCQRVNENGVDLNRNWDAHWQPQDENSYDAADTNPGTAPFSEPETRALKTLVDTLRPDVFITVHSGTLGMYTPYAYSRDLPNNDPTDLKRMTNILDALNPTYCQCPSGAAGKDVGYLCPGTCLDYAYEHHASISFAFEIYAPDQDEIHRQYHNDHQQVLLELAEGAGRVARGHGQHGHPHGHPLDHRHGAAAATAKAPPAYSCFLQAAQGASAALEARLSDSPSDCFGWFNPTDEDTYQKTVSMWSEAFLKMVDMSAQSNPRGGGGGGGSPGGSVTVTTTSTQVSSTDESGGGGGGGGGGGNAGLLGQNSAEHRKKAVLKPAMEAMGQMLRMKELKRKVQPSNRLRGRRGRPAAAVPPPVTTASAADEAMNAATVIQKQMYEARESVPDSERAALPPTAGGAQFEDVAAVQGENLDTAGLARMDNGEDETVLPEQVSFGIGDVGRMDSAREASLEAASGEYSMPAPADDGGGGGAQSSRRR